jgi:hypothetical protein
LSLPPEESLEPDPPPLFEPESPLLVEPESPPPLESDAPLPLGPELSLWLEPPPLGPEWSRSSESPCESESAGFAFASGSTESVFESVVTCESTVASDSVSWLASEADPDPASSLEPPARSSVPA